MRQVNLFFFTFFRHTIGHIDTGTSTTHIYIYIYIYIYCMYIHNMYVFILSLLHL